MILKTPLADKTVKLHLVQLQNTSILEQLRLEEALLRADDNNWCLINSGCPKAIVMGISGKVDQMLNYDLLKQHPIPVIRRFSGGGTVVIDPSTIFITWICNAVDSAVPCCPTKLHEWSASFYQASFPSLKMHLRENDYVIGDRKFGGNAQYLCKGRWLHHSSLLWDYHPDNMEYLQIPPKMPNYREKRQHDDFLCRINNYFPNIADFNRNLVKKLSECFHVNEVSQKSLAEVLLRPHRKVTQLLEIATYNH